MSILDRNEVILAKCEDAVCKIQKEHCKDVISAIHACFVGRMKNHGLQIRCNMGVSFFLVHTKNGDIFTLTDYPHVTSNTVINELRDLELSLDYFVMTHADGDFIFDVPSLR